MLKSGCCQTCEQVVLCAARSVCNMMVFWNSIWLVYAAPNTAEGTDLDAATPYTLPQFS